MLHKYLPGDIRDRIKTMILVFCDTDKYPYREYSLIKKKINSFLNKQKAFEKLTIFANPCTMQIILLHFKEVSLKNQGKKTNSNIIKESTGVINYDAHEEQINEICGKIFRDSYKDMRQRVAEINYPDTTSGSTNFIVFLKRFESSDNKWVTSIQNYLKEK